MKLSILVKYKINDWTVLWTNLTVVISFIIVIKFNDFFYPSVLKEFSG